MLNPCCCISPRIGAIICGVIDLLVTVPYAWRTILNFIERFTFELVGQIILCVFLVILALLLLVGALQNSQEKIRLWLTLWIIYLIIFVVFQLFDVYSEGFRPAVGSSIGVFVLFILYEVWVVYAYLTELRYGPSGLTYCPSQIV